MPPNPSSEEVGVLAVEASLAGLCAEKVAVLRDAPDRYRPGGRGVLQPGHAPVEPLWWRTGLPVPEDAGECELSGLRLGGPSGGSPLFPLRATNLERRSFDSGFAERATDAGEPLGAGYVWSAIYHFRRLSLRHERERPHGASGTAGELQWCNEQ